MFTTFTTIAMGLVFFILGLSSQQNFPAPLSAKTERELFEKMKCGDESARARLIEHNLRLVAHIVRKYYFSYKCQDDLISIGSIGLVKAIDSFNYKNGTRFATYGAKCIQNEILMYFRAQKKLLNEVSINDTIDMDRDGNPLTYEDIIYTDDTIAEDIDRKLHTEKALRLIKEILSPRERKILVLRYGLNNRPVMTQKEVSKLLGISRSYVSRLEKSALDKLLEKFKADEKSSARN